MLSVARGDVSKLCEHTRKLNTELESAGEQTLDLVSNLLAALEKAPNKRFRNWLERKKDQWDMKEIEWKSDGSDLMDQVEAYYLNLKDNKAWKDEDHKQNRHYALRAIEDASASSAQTQAIKELTRELRAFSATEKEIREEKYKWKKVPPKDGEDTTKRVLVDGVKKKYYWCVYHHMWTLHSPQECRASKSTKKRKSPSKANKSKKKKLFHKARVAFEALAMLENDKDSENSSNISLSTHGKSNVSFADSNKSDASIIDSPSSFKTAVYDTDSS
jgi:hypothetical protein